MPSITHSHPEERPKGASRRTQHRDAALTLNSFTASPRNASERTLHFVLSALVSLAVTLATIGAGLHPLRALDAGGPRLPHTFYTSFLFHFPARPTHHPPPTHAP